MANELCTNCWRFTVFKSDCHFHWDGKQECSRFMQHELDEERYRTIVDNTYLF